MGFTLIKGTFHPDAGIPDGDSVRFMADDDRLLEGLPGRPVEFKADGTVQLRYEGVDAIEKRAKEPLASQSRDKNFEFLRALGQEETPRGYILTRQCDANRRPIAFAYAGNPEEDDGADVFLDGVRLRSSVNYQLVEAGYAYTMFYDTLFMELRDVLREAFLEARAAGRGLHAQDATLTGVTIARQEELRTIAPIYPKLWRRLEEYLRNHEGLSEFKAFLQRRGTDRLHTLSDGRTNIAFDNVVVVQGDTVRLLYSPEDMVMVAR